MTQPIDITRQRLKHVREQTFTECSKILDSVMVYCDAKAKCSGKRQHVAGKTEQVVNITKHVFKPKSQKSDTGLCFCIQINVFGPLFDDWLKGGNSQNPERAFLCNHFGVCLSVCLYVCDQSQNRKGREILPSLHIISINSQ